MALAHFRFLLSLVHFAFRPRKATSPSALFGARLSRHYDPQIGREAFFAFFMGMSAVHLGEDVSEAPALSLVIASEDQVDRHSNPQVSHIISLTEFCFLFLLQSHMLKSTTSSLRHVVISS